MSEVLRLSFKYKDGVYRSVFEFPAELATDMAGLAAALCQKAPMTVWRVETTGGRPIKTELLPQKDENLELAGLRAKLARIAAILTE